MKNQPNHPARRKRALAYVRISSRHQINGESPETQIDAINRFALSNDIEMAETFYDEAKSGKNTDRPGLQDMLAYARKHKDSIDHVIVYMMNRASRDIATYVTGFMQPLASLGINVLSATENVDSTPQGRFSEAFSVIVGQMDNEIKSKMTIDNMRNIAIQGYWVHPPILGYSMDKVANDVGKIRPTLKKNAAAAKVKLILERFSQGDISQAELTRFAESVGLRSRYGKKLSADRIHGLLTNPTYAGFIQDSFTDYQLVPGKHPAIISAATYEMNQTLLIKGKRKQKGVKHLTINPDYPLKGTVLCPNCNQPMYASAPKTGTGGSSPRYHCSRDSCKGVVSSIGAAQLHADFEKLLKATKPDKHVLELYKKVMVKEATNQLGDLNHKIGSIRSELERIDSTRVSTLQKFISDQITKQEKDSVTDALENEKRTHQAELKRLEGYQSIRETDIELAIQLINDIDKQWAAASPITKRQFQSMLFPEGITYDPKTRTFGTVNISPLYRYEPILKASEEASRVRLGTADRT